MKPYATIRQIDATLGSTRHALNLPLKKVSAAILSLLIPLWVLGQAKTELFYYSMDWQKCDSVSAHYIQVYQYSDTLANSGWAKTILVPTGQITYECQFADLKRKIMDGPCNFFYDDGAPKIKSYYKNGKPEGKLTTYYASGQLKRKEEYENGELKYGRCYASNGQDTTYFMYRINPRYPGGEEELMRFLQTNIAYPKKVRRNGIEGKVIVEFTVTKTGSLKDATVVESVHPLLDDEALRVVNKMRKWSPGLRDGEPVSVRFSLPVLFKLK